MKKGFTLIELAIVLVIIGLLIGVGVSLLPGLINQQKYTQNQSLLNQNYNALIGYIMANGKAPLASSNTNGTSQSQNIGYLPYVTIGGLQKDAYGNTFYYAVNNRPLNISINGVPLPPNTSLINTQNNINNFCAVLYALNYYYTHNPPTLGASDVRTVNGPNQTNYTYDAFILISSGANNKLDSPNTITNSNGVFASQQYPLSQNYDDIVEALSITNAIGQFCANYSYTGSCSGTSCTLTSNSQTNSQSNSQFSPPPGTYSQNPLTVVAPTGATGCWATQSGYCIAQSQSSNVVLLSINAQGGSKSCTFVVSCTLNGQPIQAQYTLTQ